MFKLMFLIAGMNAPMTEVAPKEDTRSTEKIEILLEEEMDRFDLISEEADEVLTRAIFMEEMNSYKCVDSAASAIHMLGQSAGTEYNLVLESIDRKNIDSAEFHLDQLSKVVDRAEDKLIEAEECLFVNQVNAN